MSEEINFDSDLPLGGKLRLLRSTRGLSQFELAMRCDISPRHLSFVETGKSNPSRALLDRLGAELQLPLNERNRLSLTAGYAPRFSETPITAPNLDIVRRAVDATLSQHEPFPAFAADRLWNVTAANNGLKRLLTRLKGGEPKHQNILHQIFDPADIRPHIRNWPELAGDLLRHLRRDVLQSPWDHDVKALLDSLLKYEDIPVSWRQESLDVSPSPFLQTIFAGPEHELKFLSTVSHFGSSRDVTIENLRIEVMHPVDEATRRSCQELAKNCRGD